MPKQKDYDALVSAIIWNKCYQLKTRIQGNIGSLQEFEAKLQRLAKLACLEVLENFTYQISVHSFVEGVKELELQETLRICSYKDLKAFIYAFEAAKKTPQQNIDDIRTMKEPKDKNVINKGTFSKVPD